MAWKNWYDNFERSYERSRAEHHKKHLKKFYLAAYGVHPIGRGTDDEGEIWWSTLQWYTILWGKKWCRDTLFVKLQVKLVTTRSSTMISCKNYRLHVSGNLSGPALGTSTPPSNFKTHGHSSAARNFFYPSYYVDRGARHIRRSSKILIDHIS